MYARAGKPKENKHSSAANSLVQKKSHGTQGVYLTDNRPLAITPQQPDSEVIQLNKNSEKKQENREKDLTSKSEKEYRADLMKSLIEEFSLGRQDDEIEDTEESDGENDTTVLGTELQAYKNGEFWRDNEASIARLGDFKSQGEILTRLVEKYPQYQQLAINLVLHNYRTSLGGKRPQFRFTGHTGAYNRPFADPLSGKMMRVIRTIKSANKTPHYPQQEEGTTETTIPSVTYAVPEKYVPPSKFAVTLPINEGELQRRIEQSTNSELKTFIDSFSDIGSFGFSERSKTSWNTAVGETDGTRLSLGEGISTSMYVHLENLLKLINDEEMKVYENYGSPGLNVLKAHAVDESQLKVRRANHLSEMENLIVTLKKFVGLGHEKILGILNKHRKSIEKGEESEHDNFIIRESDLWEELVHVSTLLSELNINKALGQRHYSKLNESKTTEYIDVDGAIMKRHLFSSGTAAAGDLYDYLGGKDTNVKQGKGRLNTYTPYFEFYVSDESLLTEGGSPDKPNMQVWINLSENAHDLFFKDDGVLEMKDGVSKLAESILKYVGVLGGNQSSLKLVIDYTKFSSDLPKGEIYPFLTELKNKLISADLISSVYYLKSGLKYNTGAIERYQSGEVLSYDEEKNTPTLETRAIESFKEDPLISSGSALHGHYIELMRKVDVLADHLLTLRRKRLVDEGNI